ncbi:TetR/AcrR family transcriptional regulator [Larkinella soli]|uniref:TetR/AcrR family transcriptional regulator n=1 Tax=Larkinella soli TaxID=1770527 RepID=UPI000FFC8F20|nr:TetR/AcrR family transcriptional regulator [Larkinella soli]
MAKRPREERVNEILQAAVDEFLERGYAGASMERISQRAGLTKGGIYHHFRSKDHLLLETNKHFSGGLAGIVTALVTATDEPAGLRSFIKDYLEYWATHRKELYFFSLSMTKTMEVEELSEYQTQASNALIRMVTEVYRKGTAEGRFRPHDPRSQAIVLLSALTGSLGYLFINASLEVDEVVERFRTLFVEQLLPPKT